MADLERRKTPDWMAVFTTYDVQEAHIIAGRLHAHDIEAIVHVVPGASAIGVTFGRLGEVKELVHPKDFYLAEAILYPPETDALPDSTEPIRYLFDDEDDT